MPKMLVIENCMVNYHDDRGGVPHARGEFINVSTETARILALTHRALYVNKADDVDKYGRYTAPKDLIAVAEKASKAKPEA